MHYLFNMFTLDQGYGILVQDRGDFEMSNFEIYPWIHNRVIRKPLVFEQAQ